MARAKTGTWNDGQFRSVKRVGEYELYVSDPYAATGEKGKIDSPRWMWNVYRDDRPVGAGWRDTRAAAKKAADNVLAGKKEPRYLPGKAPPAYVGRDSHQRASSRRASPSLRGQIRKDTKKR